MQKRTGDKFSMKKIIYCLKKEYFQMDGEKDMIKDTKDCFSLPIFIGFLRNDEFHCFVIASPHGAAICFKKPWYFCKTLVRLSPFRTSEVSTCYQALRPFDSAKAPLRAGPSSAPAAGSVWHLVAQEVTALYKRLLRLCLPRKDGFLAMTVYLYRHRLRSKYTARPANHYFHLWV